MKKSILHISKRLSKIEQQQINGGSFSDCNTYSGPFSFDKYSCGDFYRLPDKYKPCVLVDPDCIL
ncbi:hypothetical protein F7018_16100 [Tenacibaculum aiptasiae]|uniref:Bacteriocin n=1 Tax=Tenacibaculum aiptasiae TaxID=426481 RepID=A0A7J5A8W4_9FLAO|nr:hypothetical protein [Tenacibaculum aiptasiae]KAB1154006.1 hypothetical protein F7018_16100 [Tenacibaculum aiptasiae]